MGWLGLIACLIPMLILPYYSVIGGWVLKYLATYLTGAVPKPPWTATTSPVLSPRSGVPFSGS